jgi:endonuclease III
MTDEKVLNIIKTINEKYPRTKSKSEATILDTLIATKLSQNTTDKTSYIAFKNLKKRFINWDEVADARLTDIKSAIKVCGLTNTKAVQIKEMLRKMRKDYGKIDLNFLRKMKDEEIYIELLKYKGIGVKTISCVLGFSLKRNVFPVDTHIHRILNRIGIVNTKTPEQTFEKAKTIIPEIYKMPFHTGLIKFGREICKAIKPICNECLIYDYCIFKDKTERLNSLKRSASNNFLILENI